MCVSVVIMCMCMYDMCVVSDICSWEMTVIGCGVCVEGLCVCQDVNVCVVSICVREYVVLVVCVLICAVMYVCQCLCINRPRLGVFYCLLCVLSVVCMFILCVCVCLFVRR